MFQFILFIGQIILIYLLAKTVMNSLFSFLYRLTKKQKLSLYLISLFYFPGTVIHELSHFFAAASLFLRVQELNLLPKLDGLSLKLGSVTYRKADPIRGFLVGIAPIIIGVVALFLITKAISVREWGIIEKGLLFYLIFAVSSTMFSSQQDLVDTIFILPIILIFIGAIYFFHIDLSALAIQLNLDTTLIAFLTRINYYLFITLVIQFVVYFVVRLI